jgi:uncharacterized protein YjbI with pentapeptide repeats
MDEVPDERCGYTWPETFDIRQSSRAKSQSCCCRESLPDAERCGWHADPEETTSTTPDELERTRVPEPIRERTRPYAELLDGVAVEGLDLGQIGSFEGVSIREATFHDVDFTSTQKIPPSRETLDHGESDGPNFENANLRNADLRKSRLAFGSFEEATLKDTDLRETKSRYVDFTGAELSDADLSKGQLQGANFEDAYINSADLRHAKLDTAKFHNTAAAVADFTNASLQSARMHDTILVRAILTESNLEDAEFRGANLRYARFKPACNLEEDPAERPNSDPTAASLEEARFFDGTDLRGTDLSGARLYQAAFRDVLIDQETKFGLDDGQHDERLRYEYDDNAGVSIQENVHRREAAAWTYRRLKSLFETNAMDRRTTTAHIRQKEVQRSHAATQWTDSWRRWFQEYFVPTINYHLHRHAESVSRLLTVSGLSILFFGLVYPLTGLANNSKTMIQLTAGDLTSGRAIATDLLYGLYFSIITFSTIGYGDYYPATLLSRYVAGFQSIIGALLIALLVFVLGRRVKR